MVKKKQKKTIVPFYEWNYLWKIVSRSETVGVYGVQTNHVFLTPHIVRWSMSITLATIAFSS